MARKRKAPAPPAPEPVEWAPPAGAVASVAMERNGLCVRFDGVPHPEVWNLARFLLAAYRELTKEAPEVDFPGPDCVPGGTPVYVFDEDTGGKRSRQIGS